MSEEFKKSIKSLGQELKDVCDTFGDKYLKQDWTNIHLHKLGQTIEAQRNQLEDQLKNVNKECDQAKHSSKHWMKMALLLDKYIVSHGGYPNDLHATIAKALNDDQEERQEEILRKKAQESQAEVQRMFKIQQEANDASQGKKSGRGSQRKHKHRAKKTKRHGSKRANRTRHR